MKDSVLNYPLNFVKRRGIDVEILFEKVKQHVIEQLKIAKDFLQQKYAKLIKQEKIATNRSNENISQQQDHKSNHPITKENF